MWTFSPHHYHSLLETLDHHVLLSANFLGGKTRTQPPAGGRSLPLLLSPCSARGGVGLPRRSLHHKTAAQKICTRVPRHCLPSPRAHIFTMFAPPRHFHLIFIPAKKTGKCTCTSMVMCEDRTRVSQPWRDVLIARGRRKMTSK